jgi:hypothetical protein
MISIGADKVISTILKHDRKQNTYKFALLRAINDVVLSFPDIRHHGQDAAIPLRMLAEFWLAYYWPFVDPVNPIMQGQRVTRGGKLRNDMAFRNDLTAFRAMWQETWKNTNSPADGFFVIEEMRVQRHRDGYSKELLKAYNKTLSSISKAITQPIQYAGVGQWSVFDKPQRYNQLQNVAVIPGTQENDICLVVKADLWQGFRELSLWIEALCIHEWCLFTETVEQQHGRALDRGIVYVMLTTRPDNRRPLTWERNHIDVLLMEGFKFICPWTEQVIKKEVTYDLDHLIPISVYPINELWNLVPSDPDFNSHKKRDKLPSADKLYKAQPHLIRAYDHYDHSKQLSQALQEDANGRFSDVSSRQFSESVASAVVDFISSVTEARNLPQF